MSKHTRLDVLQGNGRYSELYHDALVALWREQFERSIQSGTPPPDLSYEVQQALIHSAHRVRSQFLAGAISWPFRRLARLLRTMWRRDD